MNTESAPIDEIHNRLFLRIHQSANLIHKKGSAALDQLGVTTQQWAVLASLSRPHITTGMGINEMCDYLRVSRQSLSPMLQRLEKAGYLERVRDKDDQRSRRMILTPEGRLLLSKIAPIMQSVYTDSLEGVSRDEQISIIHHLNLLLKNM